MKKIAIFSMTDSGAIGKDNKLPWHIPEDLEYFKQCTLGEVIIMGRKTFESLPSSVRPLPKRRNIVLSRGNFTGCESYTDLESCFSQLKKEGVEQCFVIGGAGLLETCFDTGIIDEVYCTLVKHNYEGDVILPEWRGDFSLYHSEEYDDYDFLRYKKNNDVS